MEAIFSSSTKKEVLVEMVKLAQKRGMSGSQGQWKEFLMVHDKQLGTSLCDPSRRTVDSLLAFLNTFTQDEDLKFFKKVLQCHSNRDEVEQLKKTSPDDETAEQRLVRLTLEHPLYPIEYAFPSYEEEWLITKPSKKSKKCTEILAVDCEMVLCQDGTEALVKVCAVDRNYKVKLDEVVNPNKAIADYRTMITGISAKDLEGVTYTLKDVQKSLKKLLSHGTILVGHSLNCDLQALKLDHARVIDTSYIFKYAYGSVNRRPSLSFLCKAMLDYDLRANGNAHNCLDDACAAMKLALARVEGKVNDIIPEEAEELDKGRLLVHRIPVNILSKDWQNVIPGDFTIDVKVNKKSSSTYSAFAIFKNKKEANESFEKLKGELGKDSHGRSQKIVQFDLGSGKSGTLCVCTNSLDGFVGQITSKKRSNEDEDTCDVLKKLKTEQSNGQVDDSAQCRSHLIEIEKLKHELSQRDADILSLSKVIAVLARKQGL